LTILDQEEPLQEQRTCSASSAACSDFPLPPRCLRRLQWRNPCRLHRIAEACRRLLAICDGCVGYARDSAWCPLRLAAPPTLQKNMLGGHVLLSGKRTHPARRDHKMPFQMTSKHYAGSIPGTQMGAEHSATKSLVATKHTSRKNAATSIPKCARTASCLSATTQNRSRHPSWKR